MAVETAADRAVFVNPNEYGVTATYTPLVGSPFSINGIFPFEPDNYFAAQVGATVAIEGAHLGFLCFNADLLVAPKHGDTVAITAASEAYLVGTTYKVREKHKADTGTMVLVLEKQ